MPAAVLRPDRAEFPTVDLSGPTMTTSLCESCRRMREVVSGKGSRFLLCELSRVDDRFVKYPAQPVLACPGRVDRDPPEKG